MLLKFEIQVVKQMNKCKLKTGERDNNILNYFLMKNTLSHYADDVWLKNLKKTYLRRH